MQRRHTRRVSVLAFTVAMSLVAAACGSSDDGKASTTDPAAPTSTAAATTTAAPTTTVAPAAVTISLPEYPSWPSEVAVPDQALLDAIATDYAATVDGAPEIERFLFGNAPVVAFDRIFEDPTSPDVPGLIWVLYLSGYFGGRWLRGEIATAQPNAPVIAVSVEPSENTFRAGEGRAQQALDAAAGPDAALLDYAESSMFDLPPPPGSTNPIRGLTDNFGYNQGYMLEILEAPPEGLATPDQYRITCERLLWCDYASPKLAAVERFRAASDRLADPADAVAAALAARLLPIEQAAVPRGRSVWSTGLSVQGFSQKSYDQLLDVSSSFLETVQVTANAMVQGILEADTEAARAGAVANAAMIVWLGAYYAGLLDGSDPIVLPSFS